MEEIIGEYLTTDEIAKIIHRSRSTVITKLARPEFNRYRIKESSNTKELFYFDDVVRQMLEDLYLRGYKNGRNLKYKRNSK